jgi:hypothetical protein
MVKESSHALSLPDPKLDPVRFYKKNYQSEEFGCLSYTGYIEDESSSHKKELKVESVIVPTKDQLAFTEEQKQKLASIFKVLHGSLPTAMAVRRGHFLAYLLSNTPINPLPCVPYIYIDPLMADCCRLLVSCCDMVKTVSKGPFLRRRQW